MDVCRVHMGLLVLLTFVASSMLQYSVSWCCLHSAGWLLAAELGITKVLHDDIGMVGSEPLDWSKQNAQVFV